MSSNTKRTMCRNGGDTGTTGGATNSYRSLKMPGRLQRRKPKNEKHVMEVEIEKVVKARKEAQSAAELAHREEQIAHIKEKGVVREGILCESGS